MAKLQKKSLADREAIHQILNKFWGYSTFRPLQEEIILSVLQGRDTLALMPTGGGKTITFQVPSMLMDGLCLVITPLIALMKDQLDFLLAHNIPAARLDSTLERDDYNSILESAKNGQLKILMIAVERFKNERFRAHLEKMEVTLLVVDEAHCISQWGHDFRPDYTRLAEFRQVMNNPTTMALTATATPKVQEDIIKNLMITDAKVFKASFNRPNLFYEIRPKTKNVDADIIRFVKKNVGKSGIIYCLSRKRVEELRADLKASTTS